MKQRTALQLANRFFEKPFNARIDEYKHQTRWFDWLMTIQFIIVPIIVTYSVSDSPNIAGLLLGIFVATFIVFLMMKFQEHYFNKFMKETSVWETKRHLATQELHAHCSRMYDIVFNQDAERSYFFHYARNNSHLPASKREDYYAQLESFNDILRKNDARVLAKIITVQDFLSSDDWKNANEEMRVDEIYQLIDELEIAVVIQPVNLDALMNKNYSSVNKYSSFLNS